MLTPDNAKFRIPVSVILIYVTVGLAFLCAGAWLSRDLAASRASIIAERSALAVQSSKFMSQWFGTTILSTDYVLRDVTTKVSTADLDLASSDPEIQKRLSAFVRAKLATLPGVHGLGLVDKNCIFVAAAEERVLGIQSNSRLRTERNRTLADSAFIDYVPFEKSANKQPAILVSRPILSPGGKFLGGAVAAIMLRSTQTWIEAFNIREHDTVAMVDADGVLLAVNPPKPDAIGKRMHYPSVQPSFGDQGGSASFIAVSPVDGRERIYGLCRIEGIPLNIIVGFDRVQTLREWRQREWQLLVGFITLFLLLGVVFRMHLGALAQRDEMKRLAITDPLTGVSNRRQLTLSGEMEFKKALRHKHFASVMMVDIDHFKSVNDTWGHPTGDRVIQSLAKAMVESVRDTDLVGRLGGEEFAVVLPGSDSEGACILANRLREFVERSGAITSDNGSQVGFTISIGVAGLDGGTASFEEILGRADRALYEAKSRGRNTVVCA